jgi:hypothetical protein
MYYEINKYIADVINNKPFIFGLYWSFMVIENNGKYYISKQELDNIQIPDYLFLLDKDSIGRYINIKESTFNPNINE